jgi:hypothetical protein
MRRLDRYVCLFALVGSWPRPASAEDLDGVRFRGAIGTTGGAVTVFGEEGGTLGAFGLVGQLGVQIDRHWAVYALPTLDALGGFGGDIGVLGEYTFDEAPLAIALGPDAGAVGVVCGAECGGVFAYFGGRLRLTAYPVMKVQSTRRTGFFVSADVGALSSATTSMAGRAFAIAPTMSLGYAAF